MEENNNQQMNNVVQPNSGVTSSQSVNPAPNVNAVPNAQPNSVGGVNYGQAYVAPPKKRNGILTYLVIFLILAAAGVGGYFAGNYLYHATHNQTTNN